MQATRFYLNPPLAEIPDSRIVRAPTVHVTSVWIGARMYRRRFSSIPPCTVRNKMLSFCRPTGFWRKKVAPIANAGCVVSLSSRPVTVIIGVDLFEENLL
jgi:hypothetical protein